MSEPFRPTAEEIAAARLRVVLDRRLGKSTDPIVDEIAQMADDSLSSGDISTTETVDPNGRHVKQHLLPDAVVAFLEGQMSPAARDRAAAHIAQCQQCETEVAVQRQAGVGTSDAPARTQEERLQGPTLTARERQALQLITKSVDRYGYPPSLREIGEGLGLRSVSSVAHVLKALERKGFLRRDPNVPRSIGTPVSDPDSPPLRSRKPGE
ncbi:LexA family protein [Actinophytocola sp. KF-1]